MFKLVGIHFAFIATWSGLLRYGNYSCLFIMELLLYREETDHCLMNAAMIPTNMCTASITIEYHSLLQERDVQEGGDPARIHRDAVRPLAVQRLLPPVHHGGGAEEEGAAQEAAEEEGNRGGRGTVSLTQVNTNLPA